MNENLKAAAPQFEIKTTTEQEVLKYKNYLSQRYKDLGQIPYQSGAYILTFPNGKSYIGSTSNLRIAIRKKTQELFPRPITIYNRKREGKPPFISPWIGKMREENPGVKSYKDIEIRAIVCVYPDYLKERLLRVYEGRLYNFYRREQND